MAVNGNLYINGKWVSGSARERFATKNPANGKTLGTFPAGTKRDVEDAVRAAKRALPRWKATPAPKRGEILLDAARLLRKEKRKIGELVCREMGKVKSESLGDVQEAIDITEYMAGEGRRLFGSTTPSELPNKAAYTIRQPVGVVGLIAPWNFPTAIPAWKITPALICGNTIVFKPASDTPLCAARIVEIFEEAGVPGGVLNMVTGSGSEAGKPLVTHPDVRGLSFTGSRDTGEWVLQNAGVKKVGLELGGKNAIVVMDDADLELALDGVLWGAFGTTGQRCTATSRVIVHQKVHEKFVRMLVEKAKKLRVGDGMNTRTDVGPLINRAAVEKTARYVQIGKQEGAKMICGGRAKPGKGHFFQPTVFSGVLPHHQIAQEEIFGPVLSVMKAKDLNQAISHANAIDYGLSSAIYTQRMKSAFRAIDEIETGITYVNSSTIGSEVHLPFGGVKGTGNGTREAGIEGIHEFSQTKTVYFDYSGKLQKAQIDQYE